MSRLRIYTDTAPESPLLDSRDGAVIAAELARIGVTFERWQANQPVAPGARGKCSPPTGRHRPPGRRARLQERGRGLDRPDNPNRAELRASSSTSTSTRKTRCASSSPARPVHPARGRQGL
jgi:1,2-dihydroxy-3-keto-5-methylthiopentene dioxygenase